MKYIIALAIGLLVSIIIHKKGVFTHKDKPIIYEFGIGAVIASAIALILLFSPGQIADNDDIEADDKIVEKHENKEDKSSSSSEGKPSMKSEKDIKTSKGTKDKDVAKEGQATGRENGDDSKSRELNNKSSGSKKSEPTKSNATNSNVKAPNKGSSTKPSVPSKKSSTPTKKPAPSKPSAPKPTPKPQPKPESTAPSKPADKVEYKKRQNREDFHFDIKVEASDSLYVGEEKVKTKGQNGYIITEYTDKYVNGVKVETTSKVIDKKDPVDEVILAGTKVKAYIDDAESRKMLNEVNAHRRANGKTELQWDETLYQAAKVRAEELLELYDHVRPNGSDWNSIMDEYGILYWGAGENIAAGYNSANGAFEAWKASPGHNNNMLDGAFTHMASAKFETSYGGYWVQLFIRK